MNLHGLVKGAVGAVNPPVEAQVYRATAPVKHPDYSRSANYAEPVRLRVQKQTVSQADLRHADNLNIQGELASLWTDGNWCGMSRSRQSGGDKFVIGDEVWLVVAVPELWPDWTRVIVCRQTR